MKRGTSELIIVLLFILLSVVARGATWQVSPTPGVGHFTTIQAAINAAVAGDTIIVYSGVYNEDLTITKDDLILEGDRRPEVHGVAQTAWNLWPLAAPNVDIQADRVEVSGFEFHNPAWVDGFYSSGMIIGGQNVVIVDNYFYGPTSDDTDDISRCLQTWAGMDISGLYVWNNYFHSSGYGAYGYEAIYINPGGTGPVEIAGNSLMGDLLRGITTVREHVRIAENEIRTDLDSVHAWAGINVGVQNVVVEYNRINDGWSGGGVFDIGIDIGGRGVPLDDLWVFQNDIGNSDTGIRVRGDAAADGVQIHECNFGDCWAWSWGPPVALDTNGLMTGDIDARHNWWWDTTGPSGGTVDPNTGAVAGGIGGNITPDDVVLFDPWLEGCGQGGLWQANVGAGGPVWYAGIEVIVDAGGPGIVAIARTGQPQGVPPIGPQGIYLDIFVDGFAAGAMATIEYHYNDWEITRLGIDEEQFQMFYWSGGSWQLAERVSIDIDNNVAVFRIPVADLGATPIALAGAGASGNEQTDVVDASTNVPNIGIDPGSTVLVHTFKIGDPGTIHDTTPDGFDTYVETIEFEIDNTTVAPRVDDADIVALFLYKDNGDTLFDPAVDTLIATTNGYNGPQDPITLRRRAVFGSPGVSLVQIVDNTTTWFHLVAQFAIPGIGANDSFCSQIRRVTVDDPIGGRGSRLEPGVHIAFPVVSARTLYTRKTCSGAAETVVTDETAAAQPAAGTANVVLQVISVDDKTDGHATNIAKATVRQASGTLDPAQITNLEFWYDADQSGTLSPGDVQLDATIPNPDLVAGEVFANSPNALSVVASTGEEWYLVVGDVGAAAATGQTLVTSVSLEARDGLIVGGIPAGGTPISSCFDTPMPVVASEPMTVGADAGDQETDVVDTTPSQTFVVHGETGVVVQTFEVRDAGAGNDAVEDGNPTRIDTITFTAPDPGLLADLFNNLATRGIVDTLRLYRETDGKPGWTSGDTQLGAIIPNAASELTGAGAVFGTVGTLLTEVVDGTDATLYLVADFKGNGGVDGETLETQLTGLTVYQTGGTSSRLDTAPAAVVPPQAVGWPTRIVVPVGDAEVDITDATLAQSIVPGQQKVVLQEFLVEDPGLRGDTFDDGMPFQMNVVTVRLTESSTAEDDDIDWLRLYIEQDGIAGLSGGDVEIAAVKDPVLDGRITFWAWTWVAERDRFYVVADFNAGQPVNGLQLKTMVTLKPTWGGWTSWIEDPQPLIASNAITVGTLQATVDIHDLTIQPTGSGDLVISVDTGLLATFEVGTAGKLTITNSDKLDVTAVIGAGPYEVQASHIDDPNTAGTDITVTFGVALKGRETPTAGPVVILQVTGTGADGDTCVVGIRSIDVFADQSAQPIAYTVDPGTITLSAAALLKGDTNGDGTVNIFDVYLAAQHGIGLIDLKVPNPPQWTAGAFDRADVAPAIGEVNIMDAYWIAQAMAGQRTLSVMAAKFGPMTADTTARMSIDEFGQLVASGSTDELAVVQGRLLFDPVAMSVTEVVGLNGFTVLASAIDNAKGEAHFAAANLSGHVVTEGALLQFVTAGDASQAVLAIEVLGDVHGREVPVSLTVPIGGLDFGNYPNPITDVNTTTFEVKGLMAALVEAIKVQIFDLSGRLVYESGEVAGTRLDWHTDNDYGEYLSNGVYLYKLYALINDQWVISETKKLVILR